ncbi:LOW QUALITY PROTEIN: hypothetical protein CVT25_001962 [Psilocybe cyanescens]|uniref:EamA domain-containing protein n=1 Tax=Psilocybe cyanescens TaxID=93625 RepID=A0A409WQR4_PSICY|nr:LOW QUALITY PROTEIN: hypothetical protein CVT25_001962 [Psilocybe cyanescens]
MHTRSPDALAIPHLGGRWAVILFIFTLFAFVIESQLTQYVQTNLGYRQPFFIFYLVHSSFSIIFPLHLLYLRATTNHTTVSLFKGLGLAISNHLEPGQKSSGSRFPRARFLRLVLCLTLGSTFPALLWFLAVSLASTLACLLRIDRAHLIFNSQLASNFESTRYSLSAQLFQAIWNTNAFFAYLITVKLFNLKWEYRRLLAVLLATLGTVAVVYGGSTASTEKEPVAGNLATSADISLKPTAPLLGNLLTLVASFGYGLYQVLYKIYAALPSDPEVASHLVYEQIPDDDETVSASIDVDLEDAVYPPPFGFHPNLLTSLMGLCTTMVLWIPIPFLHWSGAEVFRLPSNATTALTISGIALSGVVFNAGFMILLGVWGPIIVSVGNLLTIVLVLLSDIIFGAGMETITFWSFTGSGVIVLAFAVLAYETFTKRP